MKIVSGNRGVGKTTLMLQHFVTSGPASIFVVLNRQAEERVYGQAREMARSSGIPMDQLGTVITARTWFSVGEQKLRGTGHRENRKVFYDDLDLILSELSGTSHGNIYVSATGPGLKG